MDKGVNHKIHIAQNKLIVRVKMDKKLLEKYLLEPIELIVEDEAYLEITETIINDEELTSRTETPNAYFETVFTGSLLIPGMYKTKKGLYPALEWADRDWAIQRGPLLGVQTEPGEVYMTRFPAPMLDFYKPEKGRKLKGVVRETGVTAISIQLDLEDKLTKADIQENLLLGMMGRRHIGDAYNKDALANDVIVQEWDTFELGDIWRGQPTVTLGGELENVEIEVLEGYYIVSGKSNVTYKSLTI